jgi:hypothetical protein
MTSPVVYDRSSASAEQLYARSRTHSAAREVDTAESSILHESVPRVIPPVTRRTLLHVSPASSQLVD